MANQIPDKDLFMVCRTLNRDALRELPEGFHTRVCRRDELDIWKRMPFDDPAEAARYDGWMSDYFDKVYAPKGDLFFKQCLLVCDQEDIPVGTCFIWRAYNQINTLHWLKVLNPYEGRGLGRALLSIVMRDLQDDDYPVYLHTHPVGYRAIKLYSDFGFAFLTEPRIGNRPNDLETCLPILKAVMPPRDFGNLRTTQAPEDFIRIAASSPIDEF